MKPLIRAVHIKSLGTYGSVRISDELYDMGVKVGKYRISRLRKDMSIRCVQTKKYKATTDSAHDKPVFRNLLKQNFEAGKPNEIWTGDITYIKTGKKWLYMSALKDLFNGEIVGYSFGARMSQDLVHRSLQMALLARKPEKGLIHHTDRGSQYCSKDYIKLLKKAEIKGSMSRKGNCYDNAPIESFWGTLKTERVYPKKYRTREEAIEDITDYIEIFYNRERKVIRLGNKSPIIYRLEYEKILMSSA